MLEITIKGPNAIYSSAFFFLVIIRIKLTIAAIKNEITDIAIMLLHPKNNPSIRINLISPNPTASFLDIKFPKKVITAIINIPTKKPIALSIATLGFDTA